MYKLLFIILCFSYVFGYKATNDINIETIKKITNSIQSIDGVNAFHQWIVTLITKTNVDDDIKYEMTRYILSFHMEEQKRNINYHDFSSSILSLLSL